MRRYRLKTATWTVAREATEPSPRLLRDPINVARLAIDLVRESDDDREHFWLGLLDGKHRLRLITEVSVGSQTASLVHPREVFGPAVREGAVAIVLIHNHPSGDATPSVEDLEITHRLSEAGLLLGISLLDHVIVGNGTEAWVSLADERKLWRSASHA
jgi:DNA repair protein RadC